jgi:hypothetical protein
VNDAPTLAGRIRRDLWQIVDYYDATLEPSNQSSGGSRVAASKEPPLPISAHILDTRAEAHRDLTYWTRFLLDEVRDINDEPIQHGPGSIDVASLVPFIVTWVDWLVTNAPDDADNLATEAEKHARALYAIVFPPRREWLTIGDCPVTVARDGQAELCGSRVRAYPDRQFIQCPGCGTEDTLAWWMSQIVPEGSDRATATEVIAYVAMWSGLIVHHEQIRKWASLGHIRRHGRDVKGRTLYSSAAVLAYAKDQTKEAAA